METIIKFQGISLYIKFLSYLWGMETQNPWDNVPFVHLCSYPTYEEWKLCIDGNIDDIWDCSYPTYEEWKPILNQ